jgi:hypothetical protein
MTLMPIGLLVLLSASALAQAPGDAPPPTLERLCGKLQHVDALPIETEVYGIRTEILNIPHVAVTLYAADARSPCCNRATPVATAVTGHWGSFRLKSKRLPDGMYWLQVEPNGHKSRILFQYAPNRHSDQLCTETYWTVDEKGGFEVRTGPIIIE